MKITCSQMDVLLSFYVENELGNKLKKEIENHLRECSTCRSKYNILRSVVKDIQEALNTDEEPNQKEEYITTSHQYRLFKNNLSAYMDNELQNDENLKIKKITINNKRARQELENNYRIRGLLKESYNKTLSEAKTDFSKNIIRTLHNNTENTIMPNYTKWSIVLCSFILVSSVVVLILL